MVKARGRTGGRTALITGVSGQDGAYLARDLLARGYRVCGTTRQDRSAPLWRLAALGVAEAVELHRLDLRDGRAIEALLAEVRPDEVYNLAGESQVAASFERPAETGEANALGVSRLLEAVRRQAPEARYYQASSSEMYGRAAELPQRESTAFHPVSPYGVAKLFAHWITVTYRDAYDLFACSGILFNHESPLRAPAFVSRKIVEGLARLRLGAAPPLRLGNLEARRDWGYAADYVRGTWMMLQQERPDDYVLATGESHSVRELVDCAAAALGLPLEWEGEGLATVARERGSGRLLLQVDPALYRPLDIDEVRGDPGKAARLLGWKAEVRFETLVEILAQAALRQLQTAAAAPAPEPEPA